MNYNEALEYIHSVEWMGSRPGLSRTEELLSKLGNPEKDVKFIHVAGTNGKGSTCNMLSSIFREAGYKVGLYTSPYILRFNERMQINGCPVSDEELAELVTIVKPLADSMEDKPTEFELITVVAFLYFKRNNCDVVVLEVGMGGRLDSTNVIEKPVVSVITGIALDHTSVLGDTVEKIAFEKAGIIKKGCPVVYGGRDDKAYEVIRARCEEMGSELVRTRLDRMKVLRSGLEGTMFTYGGEKALYLTITVRSLLGEYQSDNFATVLETAEVLGENGFAISHSQMFNGMNNTRFRARFELLSNNPPVIFDGSHNIQGITAAVNSIKKFFENQRVAILMGVLADKDYRDMAEIVSSVADRVFAVTPNSPRALGSHGLAETFNQIGVKAEGFETVYGGVNAACEYAKTQNIPLVMLGSLYMYGDVYNSFQKVINKGNS